MKTYRDAIAALLSLVLGVTAMAGVVSSGLYAQAAGAEARASQALFQAVTPVRCDATAATPALVALNEVREVQP